MTRRSDGRTYIITGSTGIAAATARRLAAEGARLFIASRTEAHCVALVDELTAMGAEAASLTVDLLEDDGADRVVDAARARFGRIDGVFNVAGGSGRRFGDGPVHRATAAAWDATVDLNGRTLFLMCAAAARAMRAQDPDPDGSRGVILNMSSVLATHPSPTHFATHAYAAAKGAIEALTRTMAAYYAPAGIRVNAIAPSLTRTPMATRAAEDPDVMAFAAWKQPLVRGFVEPEHVADAAAFLLSRDSRAVTGQVLSVDGGFGVTDHPAGGDRA
jgi:NAD(P)-dependent dehydrogenase (short-subunit alcohol dehydrogenase family)